MTSMRSGALSDVSMALPRAKAACDTGGAAASELSNGGKKSSPGTMAPTSGAGGSSSTRGIRPPLPKVISGDAVSTG